MTQQLDPTFVPQQRPIDPTAQGAPTQGWPAPSAPTLGHPPGDQQFAAPTSYAGMPPYAPDTPVPAGFGVDPNRPSSSTLWILLSAVVAVVIVLGGVLGWLLLAPAHPAPAPAPATSQPAATPSSPAGESPAIATAARQQLGAALDRYDQAAERFNQQAKAAARAGDKDAMRTAVTDFRTATFGYDAEIRAITFPNAQQTVVNTQLLPATGRLVTDLDQFAVLDPATIDATGDRTMADLQTSMTLTQQIMTGLGG